MGLGKGKQIIDQLWSLEEKVINNTLEEMENSTLEIFGIIGYM